MKIVIVIQARTGSSRLPGKVLMPICGKPLLQRMVERVLATQGKYEVVVATTEVASDEPVREICASMGVPCYSGHPTDLLDRHYQAVQGRNADAVVKIPSDCPLIDPAVIDRVLGFYADHHKDYDYVSNIHPATYPDGYDIEVMPYEVMARAWREAKKPLEREHTTPFIWDQPELFRVANVTWETGLDYSMSHRFTIDYQEDYDFIKAVYDQLWTPQRPLFTLNDILTLLAARPDIFEINAKYAGVNWYRHHLGELNTIDASQTRFET